MNKKIYTDIINCHEILFTERRHAYCKNCTINCTCAITDLFYPKCKCFNISCSDVLIEISKIKSYSLQNVLSHKFSWSYYDGGFCDVCNIQLIRLYCGLFFVLITLKYNYSCNEYLMIKANE